MSDPEFDSVADQYDTELDKALSVSGESKDYFARGRVNWLAACFRKLHFEPRTAIDYGCGTGDTCGLLRSTLQLQSVIGVDVSPRSLELARGRNEDEACKFLSFADHTPRGDVDLVYCNGVFHHIAPSERGAAVAYIYCALRPGGLFAFWENNAWSPATRYVMARCSFDREAVPISSPEAKKLLGANGFEILRTDFLFFFPSLLRPMRFLEPYLSRVPLGAQYLVMCRKPR